MNYRVISATIGCLWWIALSGTSLATAGPVFTVAAGQCDQTPARCYATNGIVGATAFTPTLIAPTADDQSFVDFEAAFTSWNNDPFGGDGLWTLHTAGLNDGAELTVSNYHAYVQTGSCGGDVHCGGAEIQIDYQPDTSDFTTDPPAIANGVIHDGDAVWSQSVFTNQKLNGSLPGNPYLDNNGPNNASLNPPAYPFQYNGSIFYDQPSRDATAVWEGAAFLTTVDYTGDSITVYDGVAWGFTVQPVPEPASFALIGAGLAALGFFGRGRKDKAVS
jgi:hypothetical protein